MKQWGAASIPWVHPKLAMGRDTTLVKQRLLEMFGETLGIWLSQFSNILTPFYQVGKVSIFRVLGTLRENAPSSSFTHCFNFEPICQGFQLFS